jgi:anti-anti-sigma factor
MGLLDKLFGTGTKSAEQWWQEGRALVDTQEYDRAIACFNKALKLNPRDTANYAERGNAYLLKGDADAAIADFTQFIRLFGASEDQGPAPSFEFEVQELGDVTVVTFTNDKLTDLESIQDINEQVSSLVDELGRKRVLLDLGNVEFLSSGALGKFISLNKKLRVAGGQLTLCNMDPQIYEVFRLTKLDKLFRIEPHPRKDPDGNVGKSASPFEPSSAADFLKSRRRRKGLALGHVNRGAANSCKGDHDAAIADYTEAIRLDPAFTGAYVNRGNAYAVKEDYQRSIADYTEAIRRGDQDAYGDRAEAYRALGDEENAARDEHRMSARAHSARGDAHLRQGQIEQAIAAYAEAIRLDPTSERYAARARVFQAKQDCDQAIADYSEAIQLDPRDPMLYLMRAHMYQLRGDESLVAEDERQMEELRK